MEKTYSVHEAAKILGVCLDSVRRHLRSGKMPGVRVGRNWRIAQSQLDSYLGLESSPLHSVPTRRKTLASQSDEVLTPLLRTAPVRTQIIQLVQLAAVSANIRPTATQRLLDALDTLLS